MCWVYHTRYEMVVMESLVNIPLSQSSSFTYGVRKEGGEDTAAWDSGLWKGYGRREVEILGTGGKGTAYEKREILTPSATPLSHHYMLIWDMLLPSYHKLVENKI